MIRGADAPIEQANGGGIANLTIVATPAGTVPVACGTSLRYGAQVKTLVAQLTGQQVMRVYLTHLHPDHIYGAGAFDPAIVAATPALMDVLRREGESFTAGMYRLLGDSPSKRSAGTGCDCCRWPDTARPISRYSTSGPAR